MIKSASTLICCHRSPLLRSPTTTTTTTLPLLVHAREIKREAMGKKSKDKWKHWLTDEEKFWKREPHKKSTRALTPEEPKTLLELYKRNPAWLGYERLAVKTEPLTRKFIDEALLKEREKNLRISAETILAVAPPQGKWKHHEKKWLRSERTGLIGKKLGSSSVWNKSGLRMHITVIQIADCSVLDTQLSRKDGGYDRNTQMIVGADKLEDDELLASFSREKAMWYANRNVAPPNFWARFVVSKDALLLPGTKLDVNHFKVDQKVMVWAISKKKGFQGVMRRHNFKGMRASHGVTKTHRKAGATSGGTGTSSVSVRKKGAGNKGGEWKCESGMKVLRVIPELNILVVRGSVPGPLGGYVMLRDCWWRDFPADDIPFPTHYPQEMVEGEGDTITTTDGYSLWSHWAHAPTDPSITYKGYDWMLEEEARIAAELAKKKNQ